jgi:hypothetical protein
MTDRERKGFIVKRDMQVQLSLAVMTVVWRTRPVVLNLRYNFSSASYSQRCWSIIQVIQTKTNSVALSPRANYTDWSTATCRRNLVPTFVDRAVSRDQRGGSPTVVNLSFLDRCRYFSFKWLLIYSHKGWVDPVPDPLLLRKSGSARNRTRDLWVSSQKLWLLDHRGGLN